MVISPLSLVVAIVGLLIWVLAGRGQAPKAPFPEIGRIMFWTGLLVTLMSSMGHVVHLF